jgi:hypothetical protein
MQQRMDLEKMWNHTLTYNLPTHDPIKLTSTKLMLPILGFTTQNSNFGTWTASTESSHSSSALCLSPV